jgi:hypothetical protein
MGAGSEIFICCELAARGRRLPGSVWDNVQRALSLKFANSLLD